MLGSIAAGIGANVAGGLLGNALSSGDRSAASGILADIYNQYKNLQIPTIASQEISPEAYTVAGDLASYLENAQLLGQTDALQNVQLDPRLQKTQMDNLEMLNKIASGGGMTDADKAALQLSLNKIEADSNARNQALLQQQDMRGVGSSDMATAMRAQNAQSAANRANEAALTTAAEGRNRALQAMASSSGLAQAMEQADYGRQAALAQNLNQREMANVQAQNAAQARNVAAQNAAAQFNLQNKQQVSGANTSARNAAQQYNKELQQQQYQNQLSRLSGMSGAGGAQSQNLQNQADRTANMWAGIGSGVGQGIMGYASLQNDEANRANQLKIAQINAAANKKG